MAKPSSGFNIWKLILCFEMAGFVLGYQCSLIRDKMFAAENRALQGFAYARRPVCTRVICGRDCSVDERCKSFNFNDCNKTCELNLATRREHPGNFTASPGSVYFDGDEDTPGYSLNDTKGCVTLDDGKSLKSKE